MRVSRRQALADTVAVGRDGFLFHRFDQTFEQLGGAVMLEGRALERWVSLLEARHAWCRAQGVAYFCLVVPEKHVVYQDKLPYGTVSPDRPALAILRALNPAIRADFVYPADRLIAARATDATSLRTDVHWSSWGAYTGYCALIEAMARHFPIAAVPPTALCGEPFHMVGDLGIRLEPEHEEDTTELHLAPGPSVRIFGNTAFAMGQTEIYETDDPAKPRAVLFRDSNAAAMLRYLLPHFSRLVCVACPEMFHDLVRSERPDIVITQTTERLLARSLPADRDGPLLYPTDFCAYSFSDLSGLALPLPHGRTPLVINFRMGGDSQNYRGEGWSHPEPNHIWMVGDVSTLKLPPSHTKRTRELHLDVTPFLVPPRVVCQRLELLIDGVRVLEASIVRPTTLSLRLPAHLAAGSAFELTIRHPDGISPATLGDTDDRLISLCVSELRLKVSPSA